MIYLKEFNTTEEYNAFVESGQMKRPNVSLVNEPFTTYYNKYIPLGVFIQHIDGTLYKEADWTSGGFSNDKANGIAVVTENAKFVVAKEWASTSSSWASSSVSGVTTTEKYEEAITDYAGEINTQLLVANDSNAAKACARYIFPNGEKGYLPAAGELYEYCSQIEKIFSAMRTIGSSIPQYTPLTWSSTQYDGIKAWVLDCWSKEMVSILRGDPNYVLAFLHLD